MPHDTAVWKRKAMEAPTFGKGSTYSVKNKTLRVVADPIGMKLSSRGELIRGTWKGKSKVHKLHMLVDLDAEQMLAFDLTDMNDEDAGRLFKLLSSIKKDHIRGPIPFHDPMLYIIQDAINSQADGYQTQLTQWLPDEENSTTMEDARTIEVCEVGPILIEWCVIE